MPRYFKEDDNIKVDLVFHEKVERDGEKKKKGKGAKKGKKGKKGKKKKAGDDEPEKEIISMDKKEMWINKALEKRFDTAEPVQEIVHDVFNHDLDFKLAIRLI